MSISAAFRRVVVLSRAAPLRRTVRVLPRGAIALRSCNGEATAVRPFSISALMRAAAAAKAKKSSTKATAKKGTKKTTAVKKKPASKTKAAAKKPKATKKTAKKKVVKKKKPSAKKKTPKKKVLTEAQKERKELLKLKKMALLKPPRQLPATSWTVYVAKNTHKGDGVGIKNIPSISAAYKNLSDAEKQNYQSIAESNKAANAKAYRKWVDSYPVEVIYMANMVRRRLSKKLEKNKTYLIHDARLPQRSLTAYTLFFKDNYAKEEGESLAEAFKQVGDKWHSLSNDQKAPYEKQAFANKEKSSVLLKELKQKANAYWKEQVAVPKE